MPKPAGVACGAAKVVGVGSCCIDYLASVASYPKPDSKIRSEALEVQGGGNSANAVTCASRLGLHATLLTKIGSDGLGDGVLKELEKDGVDIGFIQRAEGCSTPFTYIIVDQEKGTRTCIHSPSPGCSLDPVDITWELTDTLLEGAKLVFFDGRLTEAALLVAKRARELNTPVLVEGERLRANLNDLLALGDLIVTSKNFPSEFTGLQDQSEAIAETFSRHPLAKMMITTLGSKGSVMLIRDVGDGGSSGGPTANLRDVLAELEGQMTSPPASIDENDKASCLTNKGVRVRGGNTASSKSSILLREGLRCWVVRSMAASLYNSQGKKDETLIVDTTGAGDAFIGSVVYSLSKMEDMLSSKGLLEAGGRVLELGGVVAAAKCTEVGARPGLPYKSKISQDLL